MSKAVIAYDKDLPEIPGRRHVPELDAEDVQDLPLPDCCTKGLTGILNLHLRNLVLLVEIPDPSRGTLADEAPMKL